MACHEKRDMRRSLILLLSIAGWCWVALVWAQAQQPSPPPSAQLDDAKPPQNPSPQTTLNDAVNAMIGAWELSNADHDKVCHVSFRNDAAPGGSGGYKIDIDRNCPSVFPSTKDVVAWTVDTYGSLRLLDGQGAAVIELTEVESGMYDGFKPEEGRYILQAAAAVPLRSADDMIGDWAVARGTGKPICQLTLASAAAGADVFVLKLKPGCDPAVARFAPTAWRMDNGDLVLLSQRGQTWRFEENDANTWQRVPEAADPILLVRQ
jgi:hypothetical protein